VWNPLPLTPKSRYGSRVNFEDVRMQTVVKGMVQVAGTTYRIVRVTRGKYNVVRILDDVSVGSFSNGPTVELAPNGIDATLLREIVRVAIQGAKTSWVGRLALG
jgi:hypothetical protein